MKIWYKLCVLMLTKKKKKRKREAKKTYKEMKKRLAAEKIKEWHYITWRSGESTFKVVEFIIYYMSRKKKNTKNTEKYSAF